jgi:hypothetical protein
MQHIDDTNTEWKLCYMLISNFCWLKTSENRKPTEHMFMPLLMFMCSPRVMPLARDHLFKQNDSHQTHVFDVPSHWISLNKLSTYHGLYTYVYAGLTLSSTVNVRSETCNQHRPQITEQVGTCGNISGLHLGDAQFGSWPQHSLSWWSIWSETTGTYGWMTAEYGYICTSQRECWCMFLAISDCNICQSYGTDWSRNIGDNQRIKCDNTASEMSTATALPLSSFMMMSWCTKSLALDGSQNNWSSQEQQPEVAESICVEMLFQITELGMRPRPPQEHETMLCMHALQPSTDKVILTSLWEAIGPVEIHFENRETTITVSDVLCNGLQLTVSSKCCHKLLKVISSVTLRTT